MNNKMVKALPLKLCKSAIIIKIPLRPHIQNLFYLSGVLKLIF